MPTVVYHGMEEGGGYHTIGVKGDGTLWAWGYNGYGQLGDNTTADKVYPVAVSGIGANTVVDLAGGFNHSAVVLSNGTVWAWGYNGYGQLGNGTVANSSVPVAMSGISTAVEVETGDLHTLIRMSDGTLRACGYNGIGALGDGTTTNRTTPVVCSGAVGATYIGTFYRTSSYIGADADVVCSTGDNGNGQIGDETYINKIFFTCVDLTQAVISLSVSSGRITEGYQHTAAIRTDGTLWMWGYNGQGQLGNGTITNSLTPVQVSGGVTNWAQVSAGYYHTAAVRSDGTLWTWGYNGYGQLGDGTTTNRTAPVQVPGNNWVKVECGIHHTLALKSDGSLWAWGYNFYGQLGDGTGTNRVSPVQISSFTGWLDVSTGGYHTLAVRGNGTLCSWGYNGFGQLGDGTTLDHAVPAPVTGISGPYLSISAGFNHSVVALSSGAARSFGYNGNGQLGDGTATNRSTPVAVSGITNCVEVTSGDNHSVFRLSTGTVSACGYNGQGALGDGTSTTRLTPVNAIGTSNAGYISSFYRSSGYINLSSPNFICMTGDNGNGQLGDGTTTDKLVYSCINLAPTITTGIINPTTYNQGATVAVPFTVSGLPFSSGNVFTVQISNDGFVTSANIGSVAGNRVQLRLLHFLVLYHPVQTTASE